MVARERPADRGRRRCRADARRVANDGRLARIGAGLSQSAVGQAVGVSHARIGRFERGEVAFPDLEFLGAYCAVLGLDLVLRTYPAGDPIRDRAQLALLERLRARLHAILRWRTEVPLGIEGDLRAWDAVIQGIGWRIGVEAETALDDVQAVERRLALKQRDGDVDHVILLIADTRRNRRSLASAPAAFGGLPLRTRALLAALRDGRDPGLSGIVVL